MVNDEKPDKTTIQTVRKFMLNQWDLNFPPPPKEKKKRYLTFFGQRMTCYFFSSIANCSHECYAGLHED